MGLLRFRHTRLTKDEEVHMMTKSKAGGHAGKNLVNFYKAWVWSHWARSWASGPGSWETAAARAWG